MGAVGCVAVGLPTRRVARISYLPGIGEYVRFLLPVPRNKAFHFSFTYTGRFNGNRTDWLLSPTFETIGSPHSSSHWRHSWFKDLQSFPNNGELSNHCSEQTVDYLLFSQIISLDLQVISGVRRHTFMNESMPPCNDVVVCCFWTASMSAEVSIVRSV